MSVLALLLSACSGEDSSSSSAPTDGGSSGAPTEAPPALDELWTGAGNVVAQQATQPSALGLVSADGRTVTVGDPSTGKEVARVQVPRGLDVCSFAAQPEGRLVGVLMRGNRHDCTIAGVVDLTTEKLRWRRIVLPRGRYNSGLDLAIGERALIATMFCDEVHRLDLRTGKPLGIIGPRDRKCGMEAASDGRYVYLLDDPETADTPDDNGTGFIPPSDAEGAFELYDADSGRRIWSRTLKTTRGASADAILSSDPLILSSTEGGHSTNRLVGRNGKPGAYLGLESEYAKSPTVVGQVDGVIFLQYSDRYEGPVTGLDTGLPIYAYDTATGEELWHRAPAFDNDSRGARTSLAAVDDQGLLLAQSVVSLDADKRQVQQTWLTRLAPNDGAVETLGSASGAPIQLTPDVLVTSDYQSGDAGFAVPDSGEDRTYELPPAVSEPAWGDDDILPVEVLDACRSVSDASLRLLGVDWSGRPAPESCRWREDDAPTYLERTLSVDVSAVSPGEQTYSPTPTPSDDASDRASDGPVSAADSASAGLAATEDTTPVSLPGLGDEARIQLDDDDSFGFSARLLVRYRNVIVDASASQDITLSDRGADSVPEAQVDDALLAAVGDVLTELGADVTTPTAADQGSFSKVGNACALLGDQVADVLDDPSRLRTTPMRQTGSRKAACEWREYDAEDGDYSGDYVEAVVYAMPGSPLGLDADANATRLARQLGGFGRTTKVPQLGSGTWIDHYRDSKFGTGGVDVVTLRDNVVVSVDYTDFNDSDGPPTKAEMQRTAVAMARTLADSAR